AVKSELVDAPYIAEAPMVLECRVLHTFELGMHTQFIGEILDVKVEESALDENGNPDIQKLRPAIYSTGSRAYYGIGELLAVAYKYGDKFKK
ncbi:MAG: flavin reductase, partial [bacterium]